MLEADSLRKILFGKAITAVNSLSLKCRIGNENFVPPTNGAVYGEFWFRTGKSKQIELGGKGSFECTPGIMQFTLFAPENSGDGPILKVGDQLKNMWNRQQWAVPPDGYVTFEVVNSEPMDGIVNGHKVVIVDGGFDFYHRNTATNNLLDD